MACVSAHTKLKGWNPAPGSTNPITVVIGLCGCPLPTPTFPYAAMVIMDNGAVVVSGGLGNDPDITLFLNKVRGKVNGHPLTEHDGRPINIVVPCPPPKAALTVAQMTALATAVAIPNTDLASVFNMPAAGNGELLMASGSSLEAAEARPPA